jgi:pyruvate, orthophosphate dikinase
MAKYVYDFSEGKAGMKELLGGKGANLAEMTNIGIPVPFGFTITTEVCDLYYKAGRKYPDGLTRQVDDKLKLLEKKMGKAFGDPKNPLLVSVRSGAASSMPGMMDTILNLGLNDSVVAGLIAKTGNERFVWDSYRRFIQMFGDVVMEVEHDEFEHILDAKKKERKVKLDTDLTAADLKDIVTKYKQMIEKHGKGFPDEPRKQLDMAVDAVFGSWNNDRAVLYRKLNDIKGLLGTAVNVQAMVFGNMGDTSGTGVCFTRNPSTGENKFYGEYLMNAQGEDVVAGIRTPLPVDQLEKENPVVYKQLLGFREKLEKHYKDMQDIEFTIENGTLYILQTRNGKRTATAAVRIAVEMVGEGMIDKDAAVMRVNPASLDQLLHKQIDRKSAPAPIAKGLPASPGAAVGQVTFDAKRAHELAENGKKVILVRTETSPEDLIGMNASQGILTSRGGMTSHAAVVARGMGKCCIAGCTDVVVHKDHFEAKGKKVKEGDWITLDGSTGEVFLGQLKTVDPEIGGTFGQLMEWADAVRKIGVRANADVPRDAEAALRFGAEGIGLCRTEHMFFEGERIKAMREMILANDTAGRKKALDKLLPFQKSDFKGLFEIMKGKPVTIRLLDPPLHEFLPKHDEEIKLIADDTGHSVKQIKERIESLHEVNPMLGHRGCRLGIVYPEITEMQTRAIIEAALEADDPELLTEIMIPLVGEIAELTHQKDIIKRTADEIIAASGKKLHYLIGTMIEVPRSAIIADEIAKEAEFFSFGTNDLTQMTYGYSRDDIRSFLPAYLDKGIIEKDPFQAIDQKGVGSLVEMGVKKGKSVRKDLELGVCGEHGGEPSSVEFFHRVGLDYVSASPFRVPIARLAAAQAAIKDKRK